MKTYKIKYYLRRLGLFGTLKHLLSKLNVLDFNTYEYLYENYYRFLKEDNFENELIEWYKCRIGENINPLENPKTFNEKIQWLKLNDYDDLKTICADKFLVREYVAKKIGESYLVPIYGCWNNFEDIDFSELPNSMIFKSTTGSARYKIINNKNDINFTELKRLMDSWNSLPFGYAGMEIQYLPIERKILCEKLLDMNGPSVVDYKIHCFNGRPLVVEYISDRNSNNLPYLETWFDTNWNKLNILMKNGYNHSVTPSPPKNLKLMLNISQILSKDFLYVRVDLYEINGKVYFGELTFTPANGTDAWLYKSSEILMGKLITLPFEDEKSDEEITSILSELRHCM